MDTRSFTSTLHDVTVRDFGLAMGVRDWRQVMSTILVNITKADFGLPDAEDHEINAVHTAFGHSQAIAEAHYSLQMTNALPELSHTAVSSMQRVSIKWHATIGQTPNGHQEPSSGQLSTISGNDPLDERLLGSLTTAIDASMRASVTRFGSDFIGEFRTFAQSMGNGILRGIYDIFEEKGTGIGQYDFYI